MIEEFNKEFIELSEKDQKAILNLIQFKNMNKKTEYKKRIDKAIEYLTSYSSIHTIQFGVEEENEKDLCNNKDLEEKTLTEMTHRYLKVHDKLLKILEGAEW